MNFLTEPTRCAAKTKATIAKSLASHPNPQRVAQLEANLLSHQNGTGTLTQSEQQELDAAHRALEQIDTLQDTLHQRNQQLSEIEQAIDDHQATLLDWRNFDC